MSGGWTDKMGPDIPDLGGNWLRSLGGTYFLVDKGVMAGGTSRNVLVMWPPSSGRCGLLFRIYMYVLLPYHMFVLFTVPPNPADYLHFYCQTLN